MKTKQKMSSYLESERKTGNFENDISITDYDVRISSIFGKFGTGLPVFPEIGIEAWEDRSGMYCIQFFHNYKLIVPFLKVIYSRFLQLL